MKECPSCKQVYADETLNFCLADGSTLTTLPEAAEATLVLSKPVANSESATRRNGVNPLFAYFSVGLIALIVGGAVVAWYNLEPQPPVSNTQIGKADAMNTNSVTPSPKPSPEDEVRRALDGWVHTLVDHDLEKHLSHYAERLDSYRGKANASSAEVRKYNEYLFAKYTEFRLTIRNLRVVQSGSDFVTTYESVYDFLGSKRHSGIDRKTEMRWRNINGNWKIVSER